MNRFNYIGMLAYVALSMSSCDDSFDVSSKSRWGFGCFSGRV